MQKHYTISRIIIYVLIYIFPCLSHAQNQYNLLVPIRENGLWGFMDTAGQVVIAPKFLSAGDFSEGLAPVRIAGSYGYVNEKGKMQIKAQFDYAESFIDGLGKVWIDAKPFFVDKKGRLTYSNRFQKINGFKDGEKRAIVTVNNKMGLIDRQGRLVLDTVYGAIVRWTENRFICSYSYTDSMVTAPIFIQNRQYTSTFSAICILDSIGVVVVPTGIFSQIKSDVSSGFANVEIIGDTTTDYTRRLSRYITTDGQLLIPELWNFKKNEIVQASLTATNLGPGHRNWLLRSKVYGQGISYYNRSGKKIWQEKMNGFSQSAPAKKIFADQKIEWIPAIVKSIPENFPGLLKDSLYGLVRKEDTTLYYLYGKNSMGFKAFKGYFINNTLDTHFYKEPSFNLEILEKDGKWGDMMYRRRVVCRSGSDGLQSLAPKSMYEFTIPDFDGTVEAQIRLVVWVDPIYYKSQPVKVRINPSQLWRNPIDSPSGIIEPYYDIGW